MRRVEWFFTVLILAIGISIIIAEIVVSSTRPSACLRFEFLHNLTKAVGICFVVLFALYFLSILHLLKALDRKFNRVKLTGFAVFEKEFKKLFMLLFLFGSSFLARFILDYLCSDLFVVDPCPEPKDVEAIGQMIIYDLLKGYVFDFFPIAAVMYLHCRNFSEKN